MKAATDVKGTDCELAWHALSLYTVACTLGSGAFWYSVWHGHRHQPEAERHVGCIVLQMLQGDADQRVVAHRVYELHENSCASDKRLKKYDGGCHQLFQALPETTQQVMDDLTDWLTERT